MMTIALSLLVAQTLQAQEKAKLETKIERSANKNQATVTITNPSLPRMPIQRSEQMGGDHQDEYRRYEIEDHDHLPQKSGSSISK